MTVMQRVTLQSMKKNRRRTVITIIGGIISVAMVTAIMVLIASYSKLMEIHTLTYVSSWHAQFTKQNIQAQEALEKNNSIDVYGFTRNKGFVNLPSEKTNTRKYLMLAEYSANAMPVLPIKVQAGRLPNAKGEVFLSEEFIGKAQTKWALGQQIELETGFFWQEDSETGERIKKRTSDAFINDDSWEKDGKQTFTLVGYGQMGYLENSYQNSYTALTMMDTSTLAKDDLFDIVLRMKSIKPKTYDELEDISVELGKASGKKAEYFANNRLIALGGNIFGNEIIKTFAGFIATLLLIVLLGGTSLMYNAFSISLSERVRTLGLLAGVGATRKQKRNSVFFEAALIGTVAIPVGMLTGIGGIAVVIKIIGVRMSQMFFAEEVAMQIAVPWWGVLFTVLFAVFVLLISAWKPARVASKISAIDAMRASGEVKVSRVRGGGLIGRLFGFEATIGTKNSKRNRKRYISIIIALTVSVVLFLSVSSAMAYARQSTGMIGNDKEDTVMALLYPEQDSETGEYTNYQYENFNKIAKDLRALQGAGEVDIFMDTEMGELFLSPAQKIKEEQTSEATEAANDTYYIRAILADEETYKRYAEKALPTGKTKQDGALQGILLSPVQYYNGEKFVKEELMNIKQDDILQVEFHTENQKFYNLQLTASMEDFPRNISSSYDGHNILCVLIPYDSLPLEMFTNENIRGATIDLGANATNADIFTQEIEEYTSENEISAYVRNILKDKEQDASILFVISVLTYGFLALISLVCAANIFNTVSTSITLRAREFAMLRSVGLTQKGIKKMMTFETLMYGAKALLFGIPIGVLLSYGMYWILIGGFEFAFFMPVYSFVVVLVGVFAIVGTAMVYARNKVAKLNIVDTLKKENW